MKTGEYVMGQNVHSCVTLHIHMKIKLLLNRFKGKQILFYQITVVKKYDYVYPILHIVPTKKEEIYIHNLSDSAIVDNAILSSTDDPVQAIADMKTKNRELCKSKQFKSRICNRSRKS